MATAAKVGRKELCCPREAEFGIALPAGGAGALGENQMTKAGLKLKKLNRLVLGCIEAKFCK